MKKTIIIVILLFLKTLQSYPQSDKNIFKRYSLKEGLSNGWVRCFYQDKTGFLWIGTADGLNRFDGYDFKIYRPLDQNLRSLGNIHINAITEKNINELWVCTDLGLFVLDYKKDQLLFEPLFESLSVFCVLPDEDSTFWFGTDAGVVKYNSHTKSKTIYIHNSQDNKSLSNNYINTLFKDSESNIWVGTKHGLNLLDKKNGKITSFLPSNKKDAISGNDILAITQDSYKRIWIGTALNGLFTGVCDNLGNYKFTKILNGNINNLLTDNKNNIWIGKSSNQGLVRINPTDSTGLISTISNKFYYDKFDPFSISDNSISSLYQDKNGDIWIGTTRNGFNYFSYRKKKFHIIQADTTDNKSIRNNIVNSIFEEENFLWFGTEGGLSRLDKKTKKYQYFQHHSVDNLGLGSDQVFEIYKDKQGNLWVGNWAGGLNVFDYQTNTFKHYRSDEKPFSVSSDNIANILQDSRGNLWVGTIRGGINRFDYQTSTFESFLQNKNDPESFYHKSANKILETKSGKLYMSSYFSIELFDYKTKKFKHYVFDKSDSFKGSKIVTLFEDSENNIWVGTNIGLYLFNEQTGEFVKHDIDNNLTNSTIQSIIEDNNQNLWISSDNGIFRINKAVLLPSKPNVYHFNEIDGISGNEFIKRSSLLNKEGVIYFGSTSGVTYFHPDSIAFNTIPPQIVITEIKILSAQLSKSLKYVSLPGNVNNIDSIELSYKNPNLIINFAALNFLQNEKNQYQYKLVGYDNDWIDAGLQRSVTYTNIAPGKYAFYVKGSNNDGIWSNIPKVIHIIITPPWWKTIVFKIILTLLIVTIIFSIHSARTAFLKKQNALLEQKVANRTHELTELNTILEERQEEIFLQNEELETHRNNLEKLVKERTSELIEAKQKEEEARKKAEDADKLKSAFIANMDHEIRTPMNAIYGFTDLLSYDSISREDKLKFIEIIKDSCNSLLVLIDDILDLSRIESSNFTLKNTSFKINKLLEEIEKVYQKNDEKPINIQLITSKEDLEIYGDRLRLRQVIINLLNNSFKYTESGDIKFGYKVLDDELRFFVSDTGIGIPATELGKIFDLFYKIEKNKDKIYRGTGIGLTMCKRLIDLMGGKIWADSVPQRGSVFYFTIPTKNNTNFYYPIEEIDIKDINLKGYTIIIAEDEALNFELVAYLIKPLGAKIEWAQDGKEAVDLTLKKSINQKCIVLMDIKMPIMDGFEANRLIKSQFPDIPVIAITAYSQIEDKQKIIDEKFDEYIPKPVNKNLLFQILKKYSNK